MNQIFQLTVDADVSEDSYEVRATIHSGGLLNLFERTNLTAESSGDIRNGHVVWRSYNLDHHYSRKHRTINLTAGDDGAITSVIEPNYRLWGEPPATEEQRRRSRDPVSTMVAMAIDVGQSASRVMHNVVPRAQLDLARAFRSLGTAYERGRDLVQIGAYVSGSDPALDQAIQLHAPMSRFLQQDMHEGASYSESVRALKATLEGAAS